MNLLKETLDAIAESGHVHTDIIFIGSQVSGHSCSWDEFTLLADFEYDDGFGAQLVAHDLTIVFSDLGQLRRQEYDGSESWEFIGSFKRPDTAKRIARLAGDGWSTLEHNNG